MYRKGKNKKSVILSIEQSGFKNVVHGPQVVRKAHSGDRRTPQIQCKILLIWSVTKGKD